MSNQEQKDSLAMALEHIAHTIKREDTRIQENPVLDMQYHGEPRGFGTNGWLTVTLSVRMYLPEMDERGTV